jgi:uncharacterized protein (TIRG00374 family)
MTPKTISRPKYWRSVGVRVGGSVLILTLLLIKLPFRQVWATMRNLSPWFGLALLFSYLTLHLVGIVKWRNLINAAGADLPFLQAIRCYYAGLFGNIFLPSLVGGDFVRAGIAFRQSRSKTAVVLGSLIDRVQDTIGLLAVTAIGAMLLPRALDPKSRKVFVIVSMVLLVGSALGVGSMFVIPVRRFPYKVRRIMVRLRHGIRALYRRRGTVFVCFCLGMILQVLLVAINFELGEASGLHIPFYVWLFAWPLAKLSGLIPITQGGIGVREVAMVGLLAPFGVPGALTAAVALLFEAILISGGLIGGLIAFVIGRYTPKDRIKKLYG